MALGDAIADGATCIAPLTFDAAASIIGVCCFVGLIWALINFRLVKKVDVGLGVSG